MHTELSTALVDDQLVVIIEQPDGGEEVARFDTLADAQAAGFPIGCRWFAGCTEEAAELVDHPILIAVPTCAKHAAWVAANR